jgi:hypothetical protein
MNVTAVNTMNNELRTMNYFVQNKANTKPIKPNFRLFAGHGPGRFGCDSAGLPIRAGTSRQIIAKHYLHHGR